MNNKMLIKTNRLLITKLDKSMIQSIHFNSLDEYNRSFVPDEVFETIDIPSETV